jgi:hypothetical protein
MPGVIGRRMCVDERLVDEEIEAASKSCRGCSDSGDGGMLFEKWFDMVNGDGAA